MNDLLILKNAKVFSPEPLGIVNMLIAGGKIVTVTKDEITVTGTTAVIKDIKGYYVVPGMIDNHVHTLGGGGGLGFASRALEIQLSQIISAGVTTIIGMLGFDATTKTLPVLLAKTKGLRQEGVNAYCLSGATLEHPVPTLTGRLRTDIAYINEIIGVGEISISELGYCYDSFGAGGQYIAKAATEALLAGRLSGKAGYLCLQVPPYRDEVLKPMFEVVDRTGIPIKQFIPSHVNQTPNYMEDAIAWGRKGGWVDIGANYSPDNHYSRAAYPDKAVMHFIDAGIPIEQILVSSDGNGAPPKEERGESKPTKANYMPISAVLKVFQQLVNQGLPPEEALKPFTINVAAATGLLNKGAIAEGMDADIAVYDDKWNLNDLYVMGNLMLHHGKVIKRGMFEELLVNQLDN